MTTRNERKLIAELVLKDLLSTSSPALINTNSRSVRSLTKFISRIGEKIPKTPERIVEETVRDVLNRVKTNDPMDYTRSLIRLFNSVVNKYAKKDKKEMTKKSKEVVVLRAPAVPESPSLIAGDLLNCAICLEIIHNATSLPCMHKFCNACIRLWLKNRRSCPNCRAHAAIVKKDPTMAAVVEAYLKANPGKRRSADQIERLVEAERRLDREEDYANLFADGSESGEETVLSFYSDIHLDLSIVFEDLMI